MATLMYNTFLLDPLDLFWRAFHLVWPVRDQLYSSRLHQLSLTYLMQQVSNGLPAEIPWQRQSIVISI